MTPEQAETRFSDFCHETILLDPYSTFIEMFEALGVARLKAAYDAGEIASPTYRAHVKLWTDTIDEERATEAERRREEAVDRTIKAAERSAAASERSARMAAIAAWVALASIVVSMFWSR